ncbi:hypothetical protein [Actinocrispum sp. NPDC049592]|uniref:hypothetical protein n=1 Tax=Actinocrispum sp. NPDC049592 TaxID=3154835 RepID=UPI00343B8E11
MDNARNTVPGNGFATARNVRGHFPDHCGMSASNITHPRELSAALKELTLSAAARKETDPFGRLGFTKVALSWSDEKERLKYDVDGRPRNEIEQRIEGDVDPFGNGVTIGTIELVRRTPGRYDGLEFMGDNRTQVPKDVVVKAWQEAVEAGRKRWARFVNPKSTDLPDAPLLKADNQNDLIHAVTLLADNVLKVRLDAKNPLRYVCHQHVSSPDGGIVMIYGRELLSWKDKEFTYPAAERPDDAFLALLGISNGAFVQHLIEQNGNRLGITRLASISVRRGGLDVYWTFA